MKKNICLLLLFVAANLMAQAQLLTGNVWDAENKGVPYATVRLLTNDSVFVQGTTTDSLGVFQIEPSPKAKILYVSSVGYHPYCMNIGEQNTSFNIVLETDNVFLGEVEVKGRAFIRQQDKVLIIPDKQQVKHAGTGYDLLYNLMIPGIEVDRMGGKVKTFGGEVTLYIDGRKVDYREVQNLRPRDIEKVEYFDSPTGKYADDVAAINYITRKRRAGGYVALDAKQTIGYLDGDYNVVAKLSHKNTSYTLFAGHMMQEYSGLRDDTHERFALAGEMVDRTASTLEGKVKKNSQYTQLNIVNSNDKRTLQGKISLVRSDAPDNFSRNEVVYSKGDLKQTADKLTSQLGIMPSIDLYGHFQLNDKQYLESYLTGSYADNDYDYRYQEEDYLAQTHTKEGLYSFMANINYGINFSKKDALTVKLYHYHDISSSTYSGSTNSWQHLWKGESQLYMEYSRQLGKNHSLRVAPGISSLQYKLHGNKHISRFSPRLRLRLVSRLSQTQQLQIMANIGNNCPSISHLNNAEQKIDSFQIRRGNPDLKTSKLYMLSAMYGAQIKKINLQGGVAYNFAQNTTTQGYYVEGDKLVKTFISDPNVHMVMAMLSASWKATDNLRLKLDGNWMYLDVYDGASERINSISGKAQVDYYWKDFSFSLFGATEKQNMDAELIHIYEPAKYGLTASWNRNGWRIEGGVENPFTKQSKYKYMTSQDIYTYKNVVTSKTFQQTGYVKVSYTFDFGKKTSRDWKNVNMNINSAILKAE